MTAPRAPRSPLEAAVRREIREVAKRSPGAAKSWPAELALTLVREIESRGEDSLSARVSAAKVLTETMQTLTGSAPAQETKDRLDELAAKRTKRLAAGGQ